MPTVFIAGSRNIKNLNDQVLDRLRDIIGKDFDIVVGDAKGADSSIQNFLAESGAENVVVYCTGLEPRNNIADWPTHNVVSKAAPGSREFFTAKDREMARAADYGLMIWDAKSTGTLSNVIELQKQKKPSRVFVNKMKQFVLISSPEDIKELTTYMSEHARNKADEKIGLSRSIDALSNEQYKMFI